MIQAIVTVLAIVQQFITKEKRDHFKKYGFSLGLMKPLDRRTNAVHKTSTSMNPKKKVFKSSYLGYNTFKGNLTI